MRKTLRIISLVCILLCTLSGSVYGSQEKVAVIPVESAIESGLASFIERAVKEAEANEAVLLVFEMDTPGGSIDAARKIRDVIASTEIPTAALIKRQGISAGAYIALNCDYIAMQPGSNFGDAEPLVGGVRADEKILSEWRAAIASAAESKGRDPLIAKAFADRDIEIPGLIEKGKLLTLTPQRALETGMIDYIVANLNELFEELEIEDPQIIRSEPTNTEKFVRFISHPLVAPLLLTIGIAGLVLELLTAGFGLFGLIGLFSLSLYFGGSILAGFSGWLAVFLFVLGLILLGIEVFLPGFGLPGVGGIILLAISIIMVSPNLETGLISLTIALVVTIVLVLLSLKFMPTRKFWRKLVLGTALTSEEGYNSSRQELKNFLEQQGRALTDLRPAGTMELDDGVRLDVVTAGEYVQKDERIAVVKIEGNRIVVKKI